MSEKQNFDRRCFLGAAAITLAAGLLNVGYAGAGPADGTPVILLHGWPYDIHSFVDVTPILAAKGL